MAVAVKTEPSIGHGAPSLGLAGASLAGALYIVLGVVALYNVLPWVWTEYVVGAWQITEFYQRGLLMILMVAGAVGLVFLWPKIFRPIPGMRAGVAIGVFWLLAGAVFVYVVGLLMEVLGFASSPTVGAMEALVAAGVWLWGTLRLYRSERFQERLLQIEEQGWFNTKTYKPGQGLRARRATMLAIIGIVGCGIWVHTQHKNFFSSAPWEIRLPYGIGDSVIVLWLPSLSLTVVIGAITIWLAYRLVNFPKFADFLIATEAEMSKVTWMTRRRLIQDTIVVLVTVFLMSIFLLAMDFIWSILLKQLGVVLQ